MKLAMTFVLVGLGVLAVGCSGPAESTASTGPVAPKPLAGSIEGKTFEAKIALARKGFGDGADEERSIDIYDTDATCERTSERKSERSILLSVPWKEGIERDFKISFGSGANDSQTATFVIQRDSKTDNIISTQGRVEIVKAPTEKNAKGLMRLRATAKDNSVEGEIAVLICD